MTEVRMTLPLLVFTITGLMLFAAGGLFTYGLLQNELRELKALATDARAMGIKNQDAIYDLEKRTIALEGTTARSAQDIAEVRLRQLPKGR